IRGYTLRELARRAHVSPAQLSRIETGQRYASPAIVAGVARALSVSVSVLYGQPYIHMLQQDQLDALLSPIAGSLDDWDIGPGEGDPPPRPLAVLEAAVSELDGKREAGQQFEVAEALPGLIAEVNATVLLNDRPGRDRERAFWLQAQLGRTAYVATRRLGFIDLARHALGRMAAAAPHSGDPRQVAIERWDRARLLGDATRADKGFRLVHQALRDLDDDRTPATRAVRGALYLEAAVLARRAGVPDTAAEWLGQARELAQATGELPHYGLVFGPTNVAIHTMSVASGHDRHGEALRIARGLRIPEDYPKARAASYWASRARSEAWTAQHEAAQRSLE
ncbi:helix-turn-helix domain-containing protein, partial [Streptomyces klenkii]